MSSVPEKDWQLFHKLQVELTASACEMVFTQVETLAKTGREKNINPI